MDSSPALDWWRADAPAPSLGREAEEPSAGLAFWSFAAFTFVLVIAPQDFVPGLSVIRPALLAGGMAGFGYIVERLQSRNSGGAWNAPTVLAGLLLGWAIATIPLSYWPGGSVSTLLELYIKALIAFWLAGRVVNRPSQLRTLFWLLSAFTVPIALTGIRHYSSGAFTEGAGARIQGYGQGLASNPNDLALTLDIVIPMTIALMFTSTRWSSRVAALSILLIDVVAVIVTYSRGGFLGLAIVGVLTFGWLIKRGAGVAGCAAVVGAVLLVPLLPSTYLERLGTISNYQADPTGSAQERWRDMGVATEFLFEHPVVGAGLGQDLLALNQVRGPTWRSVHNAYLNYGVDLGLPGLGLFLALLISTLHAVWKVERRLSGVLRFDELATFAHGLRVSLLTFAAAAFFYPVAYHFYFYYLAGLAVAVRAIAQRLRLEDLRDAI